MQTSARARRSARRLFRLCVADGLLSAVRVRQAAQRIASSRRGDAVGVLCEFRRLVRIDRDRHTAVVASAWPLPQEMRDDVVAGLARLYGPHLVTTFEQDTDLIGGMRIRVGSDVYDGTVRARLKALEAGL